jgi:polyisoprenoid-binding protein YceI
MATRQQSEPSAALTPGLWKVVSEDSSVRFRVMSLPPAWGRFTDVHGELEVDDDLQVRGGGGVAVAGLRTGLGLRDRHLRSSHFLDAPAFPSIECVLAGGTIPPGPSAPAIALTIKGVTRGVPLEVTLEAVDGSPRARRLRARGVIRRRDFGVSWLSADALMIGNKVRVALDLTLRSD